MDQSVVQQILDHANTRGTAILVRTIREMVKDKKTVFVALISLIPIILGLLWSGYLSDDEDIQEVEIDEVPNTSDIFCYMDIPRYLPEAGNYTFYGQIVNRGDTIQQVSVNMTIGNSQQAVTGLRKTTGLMNVTPVTEVNGGTQTYDPHDFSITYNMSEFNSGMTYIVIQLYVNNTLSAAQLIPDEFDWRQIDFDDFRVQDLIGQNMAVYTDSIEIREVTKNFQFSPDRHIEKESSIMPLTMNYSSMVTTGGAPINCSIENPLNGSEISIQINKGTFPYTVLVSRNHFFFADQEWYNFTLWLPNGFAELGFDQTYSVQYSITYSDFIVYNRIGGFALDVVKPDLVSLAENRTTNLTRNSLYSGNIGVPTSFILDSLNTLKVNLQNNDLNEKVFRLNVTLWINQRITGYTPYNVSIDILVPGTGNVTSEVVIPIVLIEEFNISTTNPRVYVEYSFEVGADISPEWTSSERWIGTLFQIAGSRSLSLEDTFTPSLNARVFIPEDLSKTKDEYDITGTINNTGVIDKDFEVRLKFQGHQYSSGKFTAKPDEMVEFHIIVPTENHTKEFEVEGKIEVYSSRTIFPTDTEAEGFMFLNIIEESHKERKVVENFLEVYVMVYMKFIVPLVAMVYGISLISMESDRKTLALYLTTPMTKLELILYKFGGYLMAMTTILTVPLILIYFSFSYVLSMNLIIFYLLLLGICIFDLFLAVAAYGAVFMMIGTIEKRPVTIGLSYLMIWEVFMGSLGIFLTQYTLFYHIRCAVLPFVERYVPNALNKMYLTDISGREFTVPMEVSMSVIVIVVFVFLFFAVNILSSRDFH